MQLAISTIDAIRKAIPAATIIAPAVITFPQQNFDPWNFLEHCFSNGLLEQVDAISIHPYRNQPPETVSIDYQRLRDLAAAHLIPRHKQTPPIIASEWGYPVTSEVTRELQAMLLVREFFSNIINGIPLSIWYDWRDDGQDPKNQEDNFGILDWNHQPKPAYFALQTLIKELSNFRFAERLSLSSEKDFAILFTYGAMKKIVLWTIDNPHAVQMKATQLKVVTQSLTVVSMTGNKQSVTQANGAFVVELTNSPQYLIVGT